MTKLERVGLWGWGKVTIEKMSFHQNLTSLTIKAYELLCRYTGQTDTTKSYHYHHDVGKVHGKRIGYN